jgi:hypothetical protein
MNLFEGSMVPMVTYYQKLSEAKLRSRQSLTELYVA